MAQTEMDFERAAALFWALGGNIPHAPELEEWALQEASGEADRDKLLLKAVKLCGAGETPAHCYLLAKLYSWLGPQYTADTIRWASRYLSGKPWEKLPRGIVLQDGVEIMNETVNCAEYQYNYPLVVSGSGTSYVEIYVDGDLSAASQEVTFGGL